MLERTSVMHYKACIPFSCPQESSDLILTKAQQFLHEHILQLVGCHISFTEFQSRTTLAVDNNNIKLFISSYKDNSPTPKNIWALKLLLPDRDISRRRWVIHIGLRYENDRSATLYYAEFYTDFLVGSYARLSAPQKKTPKLIWDFVCNDAFHCLIGGYRLPLRLLDLDESAVPVIVDLLNDTARTLPIVLVTCAIDAEALADALVANGVVYATKDPDMVGKLNEHLPEASRVAMNTIHVFPAGKSYVQVLHLDAIQRMINPVIQLRHAYCECMRSDERKGFPTYDGIVQLRNTRRLADISERFNSVRKERDQLLSENDRLRERCKLLETSKHKLHELIDLDAWDMAKQYEAEWTMCQQARTAMEEQIQSIAIDLYARKHPSLTDIPQCAAIGHLLEAIKFTQSSLIPA